MPNTNTAEVQVQTKLDRLNKLLRNPKLKLPSFRQEVSSSFGNLHWLKAKLPKNPDCDTELKALLNLDPKSLLEPIN
jgi:hypothetical protein